MDSHLPAIISAIFTFDDSDDENEAIVLSKCVSNPKWRGRRKCIQNYVDLVNIYNIDGNYFVKGYFHFI